MKRMPENGNVRKYSFQEFLFFGTATAALAVANPSATLAKDHDS